MNKVFVINVVFVIVLNTLSINNVNAQEENSDWNTEIGVGAYYYNGNTDKLDVRSELGISHLDSIFEYSSWFKYVYGENNQVANKEEYNAGIKFDYSPRGKISPFVLLSVYKDEFKSIKFRWNGLLGAKWLIAKNSKSSLSLSCAAIAENNYYTEYVTFNDRDSLKKATKYRFSLRPKFKIRIADNLTFNHFTFYQPRFDEFDDYLVESSSSLIMAVSGKINFKLSYELNYDNYAKKERDRKVLDTFSMVSLIYNP